MSEIIKRYEVDLAMMEGDLDFVCLPGDLEQFCDILRDVVGGSVEIVPIIGTHQCAGNGDDPEEIVSQDDWDLALDFYRQELADEDPSCPSCGGTGEGHADRERCPVCRGRGY